MGRCCRASSRVPVQGGDSMTPTKALQALGSLCLLLLGAVSDNSLKESPEIIGSDDVQLYACPGQELHLSCRANPKCDDDLTLIYWLVNGSFPEEESNDTRVAERESTVADGTIQSDLVLKSVTSEDFKSSFLCVVTNPAGVAQKHITLTAARACDVRTH